MTVSFRRRWGIFIAGATAAAFLGVGASGASAAGTWGCQASAFPGAGASLTANPPEFPCADDAVGPVLPVGSPPLVQLGLFQAGTLAPPKGGAVAHADLADATLFLPGSPIAITAISAEAFAKCVNEGTTPGVAGSSSIGTVQIGSGNPINIGTNEVNIPLVIPGYTLRLNAQVVTSNNGLELTRNAVWLDTPTQDLILAQAKVGFTGNPCRTHRSASHGRRPR